MSDLYRLIYTSRSAAALGCSAPEVMSDILASSRHNNGRQGITGAILVSDPLCAQVLEGPRDAVRSTFERIRCDTRHEAVSVLQDATVTARIFAEWEMACVGSSERGATLLETLARHTTHTFSPSDGDRFCATLLTLLRASEEGSARLRSAVRGRDARAPQPGSGPRAPAASTDSEAVVLRGSLDEERDRTTALRRELDDARVALAQLRSAVEDTERHRDIWADRGRQLRTELRTTRDTLQATQSRCEAVQDRLTACEAERDRLRVHRDIWADRTRSLAGALCRDPASAGGDAGSLAPKQRPTLGVVAK